jgi:hypothetical protein
LRRKELGIRGRLAGGLRRRCRLGSLGRHVGQLGQGAAQLGFVDPAAPRGQAAVELQGPDRVSQ